MKEPLEVDGKVEKVDLLRVKVGGAGSKEKWVSQIIIKTQKKTKRVGFCLEGEKGRMMQKDGNKTGEAVSDEEVCEQVETEIPRPPSRCDNLSCF